MPDPDPLGLHHNHLLLVHLGKMPPKEAAGCEGESKDVQELKTSLETKTGMTWS